MRTGQAKFISEAKEMKSHHTWAALNFLSTFGSCPDQSLSCVCLPWSSSEVLHRTKDMLIHSLETGLKEMEFSSLPINPWCTTNDILQGWEKNLFFTKQILLFVWFLWFPGAGWNMGTALIPQALNQPVAWLGGCSCKGTKEPLTTF